MGGGTYIIHTQHSLLVGRVTHATIIGKLLLFLHRLLIGCLHATLVCVVFRPHRCYFFAVTAVAAPAGSS